MNSSKLAAFRQRLVFFFVAFTCCLSYAQYSGTDITEHYRRMMRYHNYMDGNVPENAVLFIGDSITQGLCVSAVCDRAINYGIGSDTTSGVLERLPEYTSMTRAAAVVFAIGVNDLGKRDNEEILNNYRKIIQATPPDVPLLFSAVLSLDERVESVTKGRNERIRALNKGLKAICEEDSRCHFMDMPSGLIDATENLKTSMHTGDGVHLSTAGYELWIGDLKKNLAALISGHSKQ